MISATEDSPVSIELASKPNNLQAAPKLLEELQAGLASLQDGDDEARQNLAIKARSLMQALETPRETMSKHLWAQPGAIAAITFGVDTGLWTLMAKNGDRPQTVSELAEALGVDPALLSRLLRHLGAMGYLNETGVNEYTPTSFSKGLSLPHIGDSYMPLSVAAGPGFMEFAEYARANGFKDPNDAKNTPVMFSHDTKDDPFTFFVKKGYGEHFNHHMSGYRLGRPPWAKFFPVQERLIDGADTSPDAPFLVDVGGNVGHDLVQFQENHSNHPGKLILQDTPTVVDAISSLDPAITVMKHDFFNEQPIKGARAYYMHSVLHDWPDEVCEKILDRLADALKPGYSKILINDNVVPNTNAYWETSGLDLTMMVVCCAKERTENDWYNLIGKTKLKIVKIWNGPRGVESLIECELA